MKRRQYLESVTIKMQQVPYVDRVKAGRKGQQVAGSVIWKGIDFADALETPPNSF